MMLITQKVACYKPDKQITKEQFTQLKLLGIGRAQNGTKLLWIPSKNHLLATVGAAVGVDQARNGHQALRLCRLTCLIDEDVSEMVTCKLG